MNITLPQKQQDWLDEQVAASRFSSIDEAVAAAVACYMAGASHKSSHKASHDANPALEDFRRELRLSVANPDAWRTASPLTHQQPSIAGAWSIADLRPVDQEAEAARTYEDGETEAVEAAAQNEAPARDGPRPNDEKALISP